MFNTAKYIVLAVFSAIFFVACQQKEEAQKPISQSKENVIKNSVTRNKEVITNEETLIANYVKKSKDVEFNNSQLGFQYAYINRRVKDSIRPTLGDTVRYTYEISNLTDSIIYTQKEIGNLTYEVDKQDVLPILRNGLKMMKAKETIKVITPSALAYGYLGDQNKIAKNQPLIFTITLESITKTNF
ncbi:MAG: gliding motility-associated peptidyl-prolyl isomerase GldI [Flavobacteriaceae bacterium]|jgi:gliding motility-associated peptidyl-prolyl isomerase|nr:gliding motility-associated peptidyl-prolyl isomerase GldI [Flavobacteriaceae bacterium]